MHELRWRGIHGGLPADEGLPWTAILGHPELGDGVVFSMVYMPTCYRRGPYRLLVEITAGRGDHRWGCFDGQDQPMRWYHALHNAISEANLIAQVLLCDRLRHGPIPERVTDDP
jgi:hypothetical protein